MKNKYITEYAEATCFAIKSICDEVFQMSSKATSAQDFKRNGTDTVVSIPFMGSACGQFLLILNQETIDLLNSNIEEKNNRELSHSVIQDVLKTAVAETQLALRSDYEEIAVFSPHLISCPVHYPGINYQHITLNNENDLCIELVVLHEIKESRISSKEIQKVVGDVSNGSVLKKEFMQVIAHELKTPLNSIMGFSEILLEENFSKEQRDMLTILKQSSVDINETIDTILEYMSIRSGEGILYTRPFNLESLILKIIENFRLEIDSKNIDFHVDMNQAIPYLIGDSDYITKIIQPLISNAVKFTNKDSINLSLKSKALEDNKLHLEIYLKDSGDGIPQSKLDEILEPFEIADASTTRRHGGIGLGLSIAHLLIEKMGGTFEIKSKENVGTEIFISLDLEVAPTTEACELQFKDKKAVILSGDDETALKSYLNYFGLEVSAVNSLNECPLNCDLLFVNMIEEQIEYTAKYLSEKNLSDKAIALVDFDRLELKSKILTKGFQNFLSKPVQTQDILDTTSRVLEKQSFEPEKAQITRKLNILIAEDNVVNQLVIKKIFMMLGHKTTLANDGVEAVSAVYNNNFDVVFMDIQMPRMDGIQATLKIREDNNYSNMPIIALTANQIQGFKEKCLKAGMNGYIQKPFKLEKIKKILQRCIESIDKNKAQNTDVDLFILENKRLSQESVKEDLGTINPNLTLKFNDSLEDATETLKEIQPKLVYLHLEETSDNEIDLIRFIKSQDHLKNSEILVRSSLGKDTEIIQSARELGVQIFIPKAFNRNKLSHLFSEILSRMNKSAN